MEKIKLLSAVLGNKRNKLPPVPKRSAVTGKGAAQVARQSQHTTPTLCKEKWGEIPETWQQTLTAPKLAVWPEPSRFLHKDSAVVHLLLCTLTYQGWCSPRSDPTARNKHRLEAGHRAGHRAASLSPPGWPSSSFAFHLQQRHTETA